VKADPAVQRRLLGLAETDTELSRIAHRRRNLPELAEITECERDLRAKRDAVVAAETTLGDLDRDVRRLETEIEHVRAREERDRALMTGGGVSSKQLVDLQHELDSLQRRKTTLEEELLEVMERREAVELDVAHAREALAAAEERLADAQRRRDQALADLETAEARRNADRKNLLAELPGDLVALYERMRAKQGVGAALLRARRCEACHLELDRTALTALREAAADDVVRCQECGVVLVRTAESGL